MDVGVVGDDDVAEGTVGELLHFADDDGDVEPLGFGVEVHLVHRALEANVADGLEEGVLVAGVAADGVERFGEDHDGDVAPVLEVAGEAVVLGLEAVDEGLVLGAVVAGSVVDGADDVEGGIADFLEVGLVADFGRAEDGVLVLKAEVLELRHEADGVGADEPRPHRLRVADALGETLEVGAEVLGVERGIDLGGDLATSFLEVGAEDVGGGVAGGVVGRHEGDGAEAAFVVGPLGEDVLVLALAERGAEDVGAADGGVAGQVWPAGGGDEGELLVLVEVVAVGGEFGSDGEAGDGVDVLALDKAADFGDGLLGRASGVFGEELQLPTASFAAEFVECQLHAIDVALAGCREIASEGRDHADLERRGAAGNAGGGRGLGRWRGGAGGSRWGRGCGWRGGRACGGGPGWGRGGSWRCSAASRAGGEQRARKRNPGTGQELPSVHVLLPFLHHARLEGDRR